VARDWVSAEEAAKSAFVRAYRSLASLEDVAALRPWLLGITATATRIQLRESAQRRDARAVEHHPCPRLPATPTRLAAGVPQPTPQEHGALHDAFDGLADDDRLMLAARYSFGLSRPEAAVRFAMSPDELDGRLAAAVRRLRGRLSDATAATTVRQAPRAVANEGAPRPGRFESLSDDQLGTMTLAVVMSELPWTPDVAPIVCTRLAREAVAYSASSLPRPRRWPLRSQAALPAKSRAVGETPRHGCGAAARLP